MHANRSADGGRTGRSWSLLLAVALAAATALPACAQQVNVWVANDGVRVNPETGKLFEERPDIHPDYPAGDYRRKSAIWDAGAGKVTLKAARNEFVAFQVVVGTDEPVKGFSVALEGLTGPAGRTISGRDIALMKAWYMHVLDKSTGYQDTSLGVGWYPDALMPAPVGKPVVFNIPDAKNRIGATQRNQTVWVDIYVPRNRADAPPGKYTGELAVSWPGGSRKIAVELDVWDFALPEEIHCKGDIWNGSLTRMTPERELKYYQMLRRHRLQPGVCYYQPEVAVENLKDPDKPVKVTIDWPPYDNRIMKYLDGTAFTDRYGYWGPGEGEPLEHIILPFHDRAWPMGQQADVPKEKFEAAWVEAARQVKAHFDADPRRRKVRKVVFLGGLDESYNEKAYEKMRYFCDMLRKGIGEGWFQYRIDGGYSREAMETLKNHVDLWVCHTIGFDKDKMAHFRKQGVEPWFYGPMVYERWGNSSCGSNTFTDLDLFTGRGVGWVAWKYDCGYCQWEFDAVFHDRQKIWKRHQAGDKDWWEAMNVSYGRGKYNGSGLLIYRGTEEMTGSTDPVASIRLKAHRRGFQDYEYFWLLKEAGKGDQADQLVNSILHGEPFGRASIGKTNLWKNDPQDWDAVRIQIGDMLDKAAR